MDNPISPEENLASLRIENKVQDKIIKDMRREYKKALRFAPNYLCKDCKAKWHKVADKQKEFIDTFAEGSES